MNALVDRLFLEHTLERGDLLNLLHCEDEDVLQQLMDAAALTRNQIYGHTVFFRGLIEFTNYCKNDCYYCGIRHQNKDIARYRLSQDEIMQCCGMGYALGFRTFVLQGGEDPYYSRERMCSIINAIKTTYPDCAITLSIGEYDEQTYRDFFDAGADRYLLRHETANAEHYSMLHPLPLTLEHRKQCLYTLKKIGFQVGAGFMVGSPYQTKECLADDLLFLKELQPHMVGIGPFIPHHATRFKNEPAGTLRETLKMLSIVRLLLPEVLLPATTALGTIDPEGREKGLMAGANVVMPNLSPVDYRKSYSLYDNKICMGDEAAECLACLRTRLDKYGFTLAFGRGDHPKVNVK